MRTYKKPMITVDSGLAEGVYAASGASQGTLNVTYHGIAGAQTAVRDWLWLTGQILTVLSH